ncbi:MAG TPA: sensor histidine kinase [Bacillales bacterium]|nr:sensor histidine kinase [Bacillales bacterium]
MNKLLNVSLQTKILTLVISLILFVILLQTGISVYLESKEIHEKTAKLALQTAKMVSFMPAVKQAFRSEDPSAEIQPVAEQVRYEVGAAEVIVSNRQGTMYSYPDASLIGEKVIPGDNYMALVFGGSYNSTATGRLGPMIRGKAPIFIDYGKYERSVGVVTVGFLLEDIEKQVLKKVAKSSLWALAVLMVGAAGSILLARNIKKDTLGLEPYQIASLYRERNAVLLSIKEGVIATDENGMITMLNHSAREMLGLNEEAIGQSYKKLFPSSHLLRVLKTGKPETNREIELNDKVLIVNRTPVEENGKIVGVVSSFRDKTEIQNMIVTLSEVQKYSEDLRAQTHEFTNKLYVLSGLLQLGEYEEAINMIQNEAGSHMLQNRILFDQIRDAKVQAILLGKIGKASEKKVEFTIDPNSSLQMLPGRIHISQLITVLGNLIDNAIEAVQDQENKKVEFFVMDVGNDIVFEVADNGHGMSEEALNQLFTIRFSLKKGTDRGYGLSNVHKVVKEWNGTIEVDQPEGGGTVFTVYVPKKGEK